MRHVDSRTNAPASLEPTNVAAPLNPTSLKSCGALQGSISFLHSFIQSNDLNGTRLDNHYPRLVYDEMLAQAVGNVTEEEGSAAVRWATRAAGLGI